MRYLIIFAILPFLVGCAGIEQAIQGTTDAEYAAWLRETQGLWVTPPMPSFYPNRLSPPAYDFWPTDTSELMRQHDIDDMLWQHKYGAPFPFQEYHRWPSGNITWPDGSTTTPW